MGKAIGIDLGTSHSATAVVIGGRFDADVHRTKKSGEATEPHILPTEQLSDIQTASVDSTRSFQLAEKVEKEIHSRTWRTHRMEAHGGWPYWRRNKIGREV